MMKNINADTEKHIISWQDPVGLTTTLQGICIPGQAKHHIPCFKRANASTIALLFG
jgi:hypothetical protein